jgi:protein TonB
MNSTAYPLPAIGRGAPADGLAPAQRRLMIAAVVALHVAGAWGLMQVSAVREAVLQSAPMFVNLIAPPAPPEVPVPPVPQPIQKKPPPPAQLIAAAPSLAPAAFVVPAPLPVEAPAPEVPLMAAAASAPPAPVPKMIPPSAVQYLEPPVLVYPRLSERNGERGRVMVRFFIDPLGLPQDVQVGASSGFARLDEAAVSAVRKARFKPYTVNGQPASGWAVVPADFE